VNTEYVPVNPQSPDSGVIARAAAIIRDGGLVAFPTETVYGLGADATWSRAVLRIYEAKARDLSDPLIVHLAEAAQVLDYASGLPPLARSLAERFWPGPLTIVLERGPLLAPEVSGGRSSVAIRVPSHPVAQALLRAAGRPIAAPSANRFMRTSATTAVHVRDDLDGRIDMILDGGPATGGLESTVVAIEGEDVRILRPGAVTAEALAAAAAEFGSAVAFGPASDPGASPGTMAKHYAPTAPLIYISGDPATSAQRLREAMAEALARGQSVGALITDAERGGLQELAGRAFFGSVGPADAPERVGHQLFRALRDLDSQRPDVIFARTMGTGGLWVAIDDRLRRAATTVLT